MVIGTSGGRVTPSRASYKLRRVFSSPKSKEKTLLLYSRLTAIHTSSGKYTARKGKSEGNEASYSPGTTDYADGKDEHG
jgi:hypothetical protein